MDEQNDQTQEQASDAAQTAAKEPKQRKPRKPTFKDWIRVIKSQANGVDNQTVHVVLNTATGVAEIVTVSPKVEGGSDLDEPRTQIFRFTSYDIIEDPSRTFDEPESKGETDASEAQPAE